MNTLQNQNINDQDKKYLDNIQLLKLKHRAELVGLTIEKLAGIHNRSTRRIYDVFKGGAKELRAKVIKTIERYESKQSHSIQVE